MKWLSKRLICYIFGHRWARDNYGNLYISSHAEIGIAKGCERCRNIYSIIDGRKAY